jgi:ethanolamine utilization protein EutN
MFIGKVTGPLVTSQKERSMDNAKLLVVEAYEAEPKGDALKATGKVLVAVDQLGAGEGEFVLVTQGSSARLTEATKSMPVDAIVIGIVQTVQLKAKTLSRGDGSLGG